MDHLSKVKPILPNSPVPNAPKCPEYTRREYPGRVLLKLNLTGSFFFFQRLTSSVRFAPIFRTWEHANVTATTLKAKHAPLDWINA